MLALAFCLAWQALHAAQPSWILIDTAQQTLSVMQGDAPAMRLFDIAIGRYGATAEKRQGDNMTPLGRFRINDIRRSDTFHRFVALDGCPDLFDQLELLFAPPMQTLSKGHGLLRAQSARPRIAVTSVGSFEASYVPSVSDFDRLDPRFRLPPDVWSQLPRYQDYGFAVFKLKAGDAKVHPMALWFETRDDQRLFFPTVHVHDGRVHAQADFDHKLYWETATPTADTSTEGAAWFEDPETEALRVPDAIKARAPSVFGDGLVRRRVMRGPFPNEDQWADATSPAPA